MIYLKRQVKWFTGDLNVNDISQWYDKCVMNFDRSILQTFNERTIVILKLKS